MSKIITTDTPFIVFSMEADADYLLARLINRVGAAFHSRAGFFAQQACEKYMKALSVQRNATYAETHKLLDLAKLCESYGAYFTNKETLRILEQFDLFDQIGRYGAAANFDPLFKGSSVGGLSLNVPAGGQIAGAWVWASGYMQDLDSFVFHARAYLDFKKANFDDGLKSVLENNQRSRLVATWSFPVPLWQILTVRNAYFKLQETRPPA